MTDPLTQAFRELLKKTSRGVVAIQAETAFLSEVERRDRPGDFLAVVLRFREIELFAPIVPDAVPGFIAGLLVGAHKTYGASLPGMLEAAMDIVEKEVPEVVSASEEEEEPSELKLVKDEDGYTIHIPAITLATNAEVESFLDALTAMANHMYDLRDAEVERAKSSSSEKTTRRVRRPPSNPAGN